MGRLAAGPVDPCGPIVPSGVVLNSTVRMVCAGRTQWGMGRKNRYSLPDAPIRATLTRDDRIRRIGTTATGDDSYSIDHLNAASSRLLGGHGLTGHQAGIKIGGSDATQEVVLGENTLSSGMRYPSAKCQAYVENADVREARISHEFFVLVRRKDR